MWLPQSSPSWNPKQNSSHGAKQTSRSPTTNMHLGHLKAYWADHTLPSNSTDAKTLDNYRQDILDGHLILLNYALQFGYSYKHWKAIVNTMLEKTPGVPHIHQLHVIYLYEANYNLLLGVKWRQALHHTAANGYLNESCYGLQPGKEDMDTILLRELEYELGRLTRKACVHFDNNATSCYDHIRCFLATLASRKYGMHKNVCMVQGNKTWRSKILSQNKIQGLR